MKMLKNKSKLDKIIFFVGVAMILTGIILAISDNSHVNGSGTSYASTRIEFGADFYTTSAQYTGLAANALVDLYDLVRGISSAFFIFTGLLVDCFVMKYSKNIDEKPVEPIQETTV